MTLYHQTDYKASVSILVSRTMLKGSKGLAGGGVYFATLVAHIEHKAHHKGVVLEATVSLGNVGRRGDSSITLETLASPGHHSVCIPRDNGYEYVIYDPDQVCYNTMRFSNEHKGIK